MGGGEPDRPGRSGGRRTRPADIDRRTFIRRAGQTGVAAGALAWSAPRVRSVGAEAAAGSPAPTDTTEPTVLGAPLSAADPVSPDVVIKGVQADPPGGGGGLALTGAELGQIAALGGASVGVGELIRRKGRQRKLALEADAERGAEAPGEPADPA
jgi:hypothetical protein